MKKIIAILIFGLALVGHERIVEADTCADPVAILPIPDMFVHKDFLVDYRAKANRRCGILHWSVVSGPPEFRIDGAGGLFYWTPETLGTFTITILLREAATLQDLRDGIVESDEETFVAVVDNNSMTYPLWRDYRDEVSMINIEGRAQGSDFVSYSISYAEVGQEETWFPIVTSNPTPVSFTGFLGSWNVSALPGGTRALLKLSVQLSGGERSELVNQVILDRTMRKGWSKRVGPITHSVVLEDINDDGKQEVMVVSHFGILHVWDIDGNLMWSSDKYGATYSGAVVGDIDGDREPEILWATINELFAFRPSGALVPGFPLRVDSNHEFRATPTLADLNGDGQLDVIIVARASPFASGATGRIYAYTYDSLSHSLKILPGWPTSIEDRLPYASASVADLDLDGSLEIIVDGFDKAYAWHANGTPLNGWQGGVRLAEPICCAQTNGAGGFNAASKPAIADLDRDGDLEIIIGSNILQVDGTPMPGWEGARPGTTSSLSPAIGELDGNLSNGYEIILGPTAWHANGTRVEGFPLTTIGRMSSAVVADCGSLEHLDVVAGTRLNSSSPGIMAFHADHTPHAIEGYPKSLYGETGDVGAPVVGDFDLDGLVDVAVAITDGSYGGIVAIYDMPFANNDERHHWPMLGHDNQQTGYFSPAKPNRPLNLRTTNGAGGVLLEWNDQSSVEEGIVVERSRTGQPFSFDPVLSRLGANLTTTLDGTAEAGIRYTYRVRAYRLDPLTGKKILSTPSNKSTIIFTPEPSGFSITNPINLSTLGNKIPIETSGSGADGFVLVEFYIDRVMKRIDVTAPYVYNWNTHLEGNGPHTLKVVATNSSGNKLTDEVTVTVANQ